MSLSDTAKTLQAQTVSPELRWLREMRAFCKKNTTESLTAELERIEAFYHTPEGSTPEGQERVYVMTVETMEKGSLAEFYSNVLKYAETKERQEKGGGEKAIRENRQKIEAMERGIRKKYKIERKVQVSLDDLKESEADGHNEKGYDPFAPADGE
ncbi:hypothetical protein [Anaerotignum sp.]